MSFVFQENVRRGKASVPKTRPISENGNNSIEMNGVHIQNGNAPENNGNTIQKVDLYPENRPKQSASPPPVKPRPPPR